jgi:hypothetical protein
MGYQMTECELDHLQKLLEAIKYNNVREIAIQIVEHVVDVNNNNTYDLFYGTPLHYACKHNCDSKTIKVLLLAGAKINGKDFYGDTPLHEAIHDGNIGMVNILLKCGANIYEKNNEGETPLNLAFKNQSINNLLIPYTKGHKKWILIKPLIFAINVMCQSYTNSVEKIWKPGGSGYYACKERFECSIISP